MVVGGNVKAGRYEYHWLIISKVNKQSGKIISVSTKDPSRDDYFSNRKYILEEIKEYQALESTQTMPKIIICNYPSEGYKAITSKE